MPALRPAYASGELNLSIPPLSRKLNITATPRDKTLEPGGNTVINIEAKDANGNAAKESEIAVVVVDESILWLTDYKLGDPISSFYSDRAGDTTDYHSRKRVLLATDLELSRGSITGRQVLELPMNARSYDSLVRLKAGVMEETVTVSASAASIERTPLALRQNFNALAVFAPAVRTDANGRAQVEVKLPDNLTRYRIMAVAVAGGKQFG